MKFQVGDTVMCTVHGRYTITTPGVLCVVVEKENVHGCIKVVGKTEFFGPFSVGAKNFKLVGSRVKYEV